MRMTSTGRWCRLVQFPPPGRCAECAAGAALRLIALPFSAPWLARCARDGCAPCASAPPAGADREARGGLQRSAAAGAPGGERSGGRNSPGRPIDRKEDR